MQTSLLKKLLHPISRLMSLRAEKPSVATSEPREEDEVLNVENEMQNSECEMQNEKSLKVSASDTEGGSSSDKSVVEKSERSEWPTEVATVENNNKAHLTSNVPRAAKVPVGVMTKGEMAEIRELFGDIDDAEIQRLYKRVTK